MDVRTLGAALLGGAGTVLVVAAVSALLAPQVEFSVLVGLPAGLVAGAAVAAGLLVSLGPTATPTRRTLAAGVATFGATVLVVVAVGAGADLASVTLSLAAGTALGVLAGAAVFLRRRSAPSAASGGD
ncbi:MAG: hypothetical protein ABEJ42_01355 [Halobacteriaceae archaeon]